MKDICKIANDYPVIYDDVKVHDIVIVKEGCVNDIFSCAEVLEVTDDKVKVSDCYGEDCDWFHNKDDVLVVHRPKDISNVEIDFTYESMKSDMQLAYSRLYVVSHTMADYYKALTNPVSSEKLWDWLYDYSHYVKRYNLYGKFDRLLADFRDSHKYRPIYNDKSGKRCYVHRIEYKYGGFLWMVKNQKKIKNILAEVDKAIETAPDILEEVIKKNLETDLANIRKISKK